MSEPLRLGPPGTCGPIMTVWPEPGPGRELDEQAQRPRATAGMRSLCRWALFMSIALGKGDRAVWVAIV